jgi:hypothetical protein
MVNEGAAVGIIDPDLIIPLGIVILDEPAKRLLFMEQWAVGTGGAHVLQWEEVESMSNQVVFLVAGNVSFGVALFAEWQELDQDIIQESFSGWKIELAKNRKHYMRFCKAEFRILIR